MQYLITALTKVKNLLVCEELTFIKGESIVNTHFFRTFTIMELIEMSQYVRMLEEYFLCSIVRYVQLFGMRFLFQTYVMELNVI